MGKRRKKKNKIKKKVNSIRKGKAFESVIAKLLTNKLGVEFHRTPQSGATATNYNLENKQLRGDVFTENEQWKRLVIECKRRREKISIDNLFIPIKKQNSLNAWIEETWKKADCNYTFGRSENWVLFFKSNRSPIYFITNNKKLLEELSRECLFISGADYSFWLARAT